MRDPRERDRGSSHRGEGTETEKQCQSRYGRRKEAKLTGTLAQGLGPVAQGCQMQSLWETLEEKTNQADGYTEDLEPRALKDCGRGRAKDRKDCPGP